MEDKNNFVSLHRKQETRTLNKKITIMKILSLTCILVWICCDLYIVYECISKCNSVNDYIVYGAGVISFIAFSVILIYAFIINLRVH